MVIYRVDMVYEVL